MAKTARLPRNLYGQPRAGLSLQDAKKTAAEHGCELFTWRHGDCAGFTLRPTARAASRARDYPIEQLRTLSREDLVSRCERLTRLIP